MVAPGTPAAKENRQEIGLRFAIMRCPRCGFVQANAPTCSRCRARVSAAEPVAARPAAASPQSGGSRPPWDLVVALVAVAVLGYWFLADRTTAEVARAGSAPYAGGQASRAPPGAPAPHRPDLSVTSMPSEALAPVTVRCPLADAVEPSADRRVPPHWLSGAMGYDDAVRQQEAQAAPMIVYFFTEWCGYCRQIERELLDSSEVERYFDRAVLRVRVNPESGEAERRLAERFEVKGFPSFFVVLPGGEPHRTSLYREGKKLEPASPRELEERIEVHARNYARRLTREGYDRRVEGDPEGALPLLDRALLAAPREADGWMQRAIVREQQGALDLALGDYAVTALLRPGGRAHERAVRALREARRFDEAVACATDWISREPREIEAVRERARSHYERGDRVRARQDSERACNLGDARACRAIGRV